MSAARKWAPNVLRLVDAFAGECRVCHLPIETGTKAWRFTWKEELGQGHVDCGWFSTDGDTDLDRDAIACARQLVALRPQQLMPRDLVDSARTLGLAARVNGNITPTPLGFALFRLIRGAQ